MPYYSAKILSSQPCIRGGLLCIFRAALLVACALFALPLAAQQDNSALAPLADKIAEIIRHAAQRDKPAKLVVADFSGEKGEVIPLGTQFADEFSQALAKHASGLTVIPRDEFRKFLQNQWIQPADLKNPEVAVYVSGEAQAQFVVLGFLAPSGADLELRLRVVSTDQGKTIEEFKAIVPLDAQEKELLDKEVAKPVAYENAGTRLPKADSGGYTNPRCAYCPQPTFTAEARKAREQGKVILRVLVGPDGSGKVLAVLKGLGFGLTKKAVDTIEGSNFKWKFKPALGPDGKPAAVVVDVEIVFRLL